MTCFAHKLGLKLEHKICPLLLLRVSLSLAIFFQDIWQLPKVFGFIIAPSGSVVVTCELSLATMDENGILQKEMNARVRLISLPFMSWAQKSRYSVQIKG